MFNFLKIKTNTIGRTAFLIAFFTILSAFLAIVRDKIFSTKFGAGELLDTYIAAFKIPDLVFLTCGTLISSFIIIPFLEKEEKKGQDFFQDFIAKLFFTFSIFIVFVSLVIFFLMPWLGELFFSGLGSEQLVNLVNYSRIMLLSPIFMGISLVFLSVNQRKDYFLPMALTGVFYNLSIIFATVFLYPLFGFEAIIFGVVFGAVLYFLLQVPSIFAERLFPKKLVFLNKKEILSILKVSIPRSVALILADLVFFFLIAQAAFLGSGSVTILNFSLNIFLVPISIIAIAYSVATFPKLAKLFFEEKKEGFKIVARDIISRILFFGIPISLFFIFFSSELVGLLLGSEKFGLEEIGLTGFFVSILSVVIVFQAVSIMTIRIFYAMGRTWLPFLANVLTGFFLVFLVFFLKSFSSSDWENLYRKFFDSEVLWSEQNLGLFILIFSYTLAFVFGAFITNYFFKKSIKSFGEFSLLKNTNWKEKFVVALFSVFSAKMTLESFRLEEENFFWLFFLKLTIAGISFLTIFILLSEITREKSYLDFRNKILDLLKKK